MRRAHAPAGHSSDGQADGAWFVAPASRCRAAEGRCSRSLLSREVVFWRWVKASFLRRRVSLDRIVYTELCCRCCCGAQWGNTGERGGGGTI